LENRKEIDVNMIAKAVQKGEKSFTDLLHVTQLPRKTLSLRLKELCGNGTIVKADGLYRLNGNYKMTHKGMGFAERFSAQFTDRRRAAILLLVFLIGFPISAQVFATLFMYRASEPPPIVQEPTVLGNFTAVIEAQNVDELYTWQCVIVFNSSKLKVLDVKPGGFLGVDPPLFANATDLDPNIVALGGSLKGDDLPRSGNGLLATIIFGYFETDYENEMPEVVSAWKYLKTYWIDAEGNEHYDLAAFTLSVSGGQ